MNMIVIKITHGHSNKYLLPNDGDCQSVISRYADIADRLKSHVPVWEQTNEKSAREHEAAFMLDMIDCNYISMDDVEWIEDYFYGSIFCEVVEAEMPQIQTHKPKDE